MSQRVKPRAKRGSSVRQKKTKAVRPRKVLNALNSAVQIDAMLASHHYDFIETMVDPEEGEAVRLPDGVVANSAVFKAPLRFNSKRAGIWDVASGVTIPIPDEGGPGSTTTIVVPGLFNSVLTTWGQNTPIGRAVGALNHIVPYRRLTQTVEQNSSTQWVSFQSLGAVLIPNLVDDGNVYECRVDPLITWIGAFADFELSFDTSLLTGGVTISFSLRAIGTHDWTSVTISTFYPGVGPTTFRINAVDLGEFGNPGVIFDAFRFDFPWENHDDPAFSWSIERSAMIFAPEAHSAQLYSVTSIEALGQLQDVSCGRVTALSLRTTYLGSELKNGGSVASARLPVGSGLSIYPGSVYSMISQLDTANYVGRLSANDGTNGTYTWFCPDDEREFFLRPYSSSLVVGQAPQILVATAVQDEDQTLLVTINVCYEAVTRAVVYDKRVSAINHNFSLLLSIAKQLPAATCNSFHSFLVKAARAARNWISKPTNWLKILKGGAGVIKHISGLP